MIALSETTYLSIRKHGHVRIAVTNIITVTSPLSLSSLFPSARPQGLDQESQVRCAQKLRRQPHPCERKVREEGGRGEHDAGPAGHVKDFSCCRMGKEIAISVSCNLFL